VTAEVVKSMLKVPLTAVFPPIAVARVPVKS
jgi:hypothetical protein